MKYATQSVEQCTNYVIAARMHGMSYGQFIHAFKHGLVKMPPQREIDRRKVRVEIKRKDAKSKFKTNRPVCQYDDNGELICTYESSHMAAAVVGASRAVQITQACDGKKERAYGYQWRYENDPPPGPINKTARQKEIVCRFCGKTYIGKLSSHFCCDEHREAWQAQEARRRARECRARKTQNRK